MPSSDSLESSVAPTQSPTFEFGISARASYAVSGPAVGIVSSSVSMFILLYYSNALGVPPSLVGTAMAIALVFDAVSDPIVGYASDKFRSRLGRRHPFMYFSIIPVSVLLWAVWNPPIESLGQQGLFYYLLATLIPLRLSITFFDVPSGALIAELTSDYDERTRLSAYRVIAMWIAITLLGATLYGYWLRPTPEYPNGLLNPHGYQSMGIAAALVVGGVMLACSVGLHRYIPFLRKPDENERLSLGMIFRQVWATFSERSLYPLLLAAVFVATGFAFYGVLYAFLFPYFWGLSTTQMSWTMFIYLGAVLFALFAYRFMAAGREKRTVATFMLVGIIVTTCAPVALGLFGLAPGLESSLRFPFLAAFLFLDTLSYLGVITILQSMLADVVERREVQGGQREEGTIFAGLTLVMKISSAAGVWVVGWVLELIGFPSGAQIADVPASTVRNLGLAWVAGNAAFYLLSLFALQFYSISRDDHHAHLNVLAQRREATKDA